MFKKTALLSALFCITVTSAMSQNITLKSATDSLIILMKTAESEPDSAQIIAEKFAEILEKALKLPGSFSHSFDSVPYLGSLASKDGMVKIYTWGFFRSDIQDKYAYYGMIQHKKRDKGSSLSDVFVLKNVNDKSKNFDRTTLNYPDWLGCIYYEIVEKYDKYDSPIYTLIGFDFNNNVTRKKYIDILTFTKEGFPQFGLPIFIEDRSDPKTRIEFEYSAQSVMVVKYYADLDKIVHNYLHPIIPAMENIKSYYVPDVSFDGFEFKFGKWLKVKNVPVRRKDLL